MHTLASRLVSRLLFVAIGFGAARARASAGVEPLSLEHAVQQSNAVFVVEPLEPTVVEARLRRQPPQGRRAGEILRIQYLSLAIREVVYLSTSEVLMSKGEIEADPPNRRCHLGPANGRGLYPMELPQQPRELLWLVESTSIQNIHVARLRIEKGVNKIPIYERLGDGLRLETLVAGQPVLLLARSAPTYQAYEGVGGWGLLALERRVEVERILHDRLHAPLLPDAVAIQSLPERTPNPADDGEILESAFRYAAAQNDSAVQAKAAALCVQLADGAELPLDFMRRFRKEPRFKTAGNCQTVRRDRCDTMVERRTQKPALKLEISSIRRVAADTAVVIGGFIESCDSEAYYEIVLRRQDSRWIVMRNTKIAAT